ncbi:MAG: PEGA domain-containing protein [Ignavibacteriales bacterium]|nr:PEGA domain-containing protein [Ignavibacteriales bacterium]
MNKNSQWIIITVVVTVMLFSGCATIFKGSTEKVDISSEPGGAKIYVNGNLMGKTPLQIKLQSAKTYYFEFAKEGYEKRTVIVTNSVGAGWIVLDVIFGLFPVVIDAATGCWYSLDDNNVRAVLEQQNNSPVYENRSQLSDTLSSLSSHEVKRIAENTPLLSDTLKDNPTEEVPSRFIITIEANETKALLDELATIKYEVGYKIANNISEEVLTLSFKGIFGISKNISGPFEATSVNILKMDEFYIQIKSDLFYRVVIEKKLREKVILNFTII